MSAPNTTPGPWQIVTDKLGYPSIYGTDEDGNAGDLVAHTFADHEHLIVGAPDLYDALGRLLDAFELVLSSKPARDVPEAMGEARAALRKARGEAA